MALEQPPHPGALWEQLTDQNTGYPYYWNTLTNQVRWDCPPEYAQYQTARQQTPAAAAPARLVSGYDSDSDNEGEEEKVERGEEEEAEDHESKPDFIGPRIPPKESKAEEPPPPGAESEPDLDIVLHQNKEKEQKDVMALIEAEQPPDYSKETEEPTSNGPELPVPPPLPASSQLPPPPPPSIPLPQATSMALLPQASSMALLSSYADETDEENSDESSEEERPSHLLPPPTVSGQLDSRGRILLPANAWQTEEQRAALATYSLAQPQETEAAVSGRRVAAEVSVKASRKRRIALPGGRFNKASEVADTSAQAASPTAQDLKSKYAMMFVKSSEGLPGSQPNTKSKEEEEDDDEEEERSVIGPHLNGAEVHGPTLRPTTPEELSTIELAEELVEKLEFFKVNQEKISNLKLTAVKIETLYSAWSAGALTEAYLKRFLATFSRQLNHVEQSLLTSGPWVPHWDRKRKCYTFINQLTGEGAAERPPPDEKGADHAPSTVPPPPPPPAEAMAPPPPPPAEAMAPPPPPPPPPSATSRPPSPPSSPQPAEQYQPQDMELDEGDLDGVNITDELNSFYSEIGFVPGLEESGQAGSRSPAPPEPEESVSLPSPPGASSPAYRDQQPEQEEDEADSAPASPVPTEAKRRKKVKVTGTLSMKKKGLGDMLEKWRKIHQ